MDANNNRGSGYRGRGLGGGRGRGRGEYRGRGAGFGGGRTDVHENVHTIFLDASRGQLVPYEGPLEDARLSQFSTYSLCPAAAEGPGWRATTAAAAAAAARAASQLPQHCLTPAAVKAAIAGALEPGRLWTTQFGVQVVYFGGYHGLMVADEQRLTSGPVDAAMLCDAINGPKRTSFTPWTLPSVEAALTVVESCVTVVATARTSALHFSEKASYPHRQPVYKRTGPSRESVLDRRPFEAEPYYNGERCASVLFVPSFAQHRTEQPGGGSHILFRAKATAAREPAGITKRVSVQSEGDQVTVSIENAGFATYVRVEERLELTLADHFAVVRISLREEVGSTVGQRKYPVRIEVQAVAPEGTSEQRFAAWEKYLSLSARLCAALNRPPPSPVDAPAAPPPPPSVEQTQIYCLGDCATAPCSLPSCQLRHVYTACLDDASGGCLKGADCTYWHGFAEAQAQLEQQPLCTALKHECRLHVASFSAIKEKARHVSQLRVMLSLQLIRIRRAAAQLRLALDVAADGATPEEDAEGQPLLQLVELVRQYNAVAASFREGVRCDPGLLKRCCHRLKNPLPILATREALREACEAGVECMLVDSSTGSGKSTQLPQYLAEFAAAAAAATGDVKAEQKLVLCVEPRALAAVSLAEYVAEVYDDSGLSRRRHVRALTSCPRTFQPDVHILYTTEHVLLALLHSRQLNLAADVFAVVMDEAHERSIVGDMLLGILKQEMQRSPGAFHLCICSATLQVDAFLRYLPAARRLTVQSRLYPVEVVYQSTSEKPPTECDYVQNAVDAVITLIENQSHSGSAGADDDDVDGDGGSDGSVAGRHILVFLPAAADVETARDALEKYMAALATTGDDDKDGDDEAAVAATQRQWRGIRVCSISGRQGIEEQRGAFATTEQAERKVIFASPVAETAVTIDGVGVVVDSGLTRTSRYDPVRRLTESVITPVTQSSAVQRAGRAGRTGPGVCIRLYSRAFFSLCLADKPAAVKTAPLHNAALQLAHAGYSMVDFDWIEAPSTEAVEATVEELVLLDAVAREAGGGGGGGGGTPKPRLVLRPLGLFMLKLDSTAAPLGKLLHDAKATNRDDFVAVAALTAATIESFSQLFFLPRGKEGEFFALLRKYGERCEASRYGDVYCAVHLVAALLSGASKGRATTGVVAGGGSDSTAAALSAFVRQRALRRIQTARDVYYHVASGGSVMAARRGLSPHAPAPPLTTVETVEKAATELHRLLVGCYGLQAVVHRGDEEMRYDTVGDTPQDCLLGNKSFLKQQQRLSEADGSDGSTDRQRFNPHQLPDVCVFCHLVFNSQGASAVLSLCTPARLEWLPAAVQRYVDAAMRQQSVVRTVDVPTVILREWRPRELSRWLARELDDSSCRVSVDSVAQRLTLFCSREVLGRAADILETILRHACERHRAVGGEVALHGSCRLVWRDGGLQRAVLRDKDAYATLRFSGPCKVAFSCLDLDLARRVEEWSTRWRGQPQQLVTVHSTNDGASETNGSWTALVTFASAAHARSFYDAFITLDDAQRESVYAEPYYEQEALAPGLDSAQPTCRIVVRLYVGQTDPEGDSGSLAEVKMEQQIGLVLEFQRAVQAALPPGVKMQPPQINQARGQLMMQFMVTDTKAADKTLTVLHRIRGSSIHHRAIYIEAAYSVQVPLPPLVNRQLQLRLRSNVTAEMRSRGAGNPRSCFQCSDGMDKGHRQLLLQCNTAAALQHAMQFVREASTTHRIQLSGSSAAAQQSNARALAFEISRFIADVNAGMPNRRDAVSPSQFVCDVAAGQLYFIGRETVFEFVQGRVAKAERRLAVRSCALTLPSHYKSAATCRRWLDTIAKECATTQQPFKWTRNGSHGIILVAPPAVMSRVTTDAVVRRLWRAVDGVENEHYAAGAAEVVRHRRPLAPHDPTAATPAECAICLTDVQPSNFRLLCGHVCCVECLTSMLTPEGDAPLTLPLQCVTCKARLAAQEVQLLATPIVLQKLAAQLRLDVLRDAEGQAGELLACPNPLCLGVPTVVTYANRRCSGCELQYCEVCRSASGVREWHSGPHDTPAKNSAKDVVNRLPLLPQCPKCKEPFYDFDDCYAISCGNGHGFCGFCMLDCGSDAHAHVRGCPRNPQPGTYFASETIFFLCRAEDLAKKMEEELYAHKAGSPELAEAVCQLVKERMSDHWPREPITQAEERLRKHQWHAAAPSPLPAARHRGAQVAAENQALDEHERGATAQAAKNAHRLLVALSGANSIGADGFHHYAAHSRDEVAAALKEAASVVGVDLTWAADAAAEDANGSEDVALRVYALYDAAGLMERQLRSLGGRCWKKDKLRPFLSYLLQELQVFSVRGSVVAERRVVLKASQRAGYVPGRVVVWEAPTCCITQRRPRRGPNRDVNATLFRVHCSVFARLQLSSDEDAERVVLPAGARLKVESVEEGVIVLRQESDFGSQSQHLMV